MTPHASARTSVRNDQVRAPSGVFQRGFVIPGFLLSPSGIMATLIVVLSLSNVLFFKLWQGKADELAEYRANVVAQQQALAAEAARAKDESDRISRDTAAGWAAAVEWHRRNGGAIRVRSDCNPATLRPVPAASGEPTVSPVQQGFGTELDVAQCETRVNGAVFDAAQLIWLQEWVRKQHEVKP